MGNAHGLPDVEGFSREEVSRSAYEIDDVLVIIINSYWKSPTVVLRPLMFKSSG